ncbi:MAG TPA: B12-binding domain-containing radical SAM protein [bacterium]|nr:B12-binding domain-containing radical SAM protein [bacterium]
MRKILLIYPGVKNQLYPEIPLQLLYLASPLLDAGYDVEIWDCRLKDYRDIPNIDWLFVGVTSVSGGILKHAIAVSKHMKSLDPHIPVVWGGVHATLLPDQTIDTSGGCVDKVIKGEGEIAIVELAQALSGGGEEKKIITGSKPVDMNKIPIELPYYLLDMKKYITSTFPIHTSRGCPHRCGFCYNTAFYGNRRWRWKSANRVLEEIDYVVRHFHPQTISFAWEDEFFINKKRVLDICKGLIKRDYNIKWESFCRFDDLDEFNADKISLLEESGCNSLSLGIEGDNFIRNRIICKYISIEQIISATKKLSKTKIREVVSFMCFDTAMACFNIPPDTEVTPTNNQSILGISL